MRTRSMRMPGRVLTSAVAALVLLSGSAQAALLAEQTGFPQPAKTQSTVFSAALYNFKLQMHALVGEALILRLKTPSFESPREAMTARKVRWEAESRLSESLRSANALLSMLEIADHSDESPRVREVLLLWLDSSRRSLADHQTGLDALSKGASLDASTAEFLEELKILWRRLDGGYAELEEILAFSAPISSATSEASR